MNVWLRLSVRQSHWYFSIIGSALVLNKVINSSFNGLSLQVQENIYSKNGKGTYG